MSVSVQADTQQQPIDTSPVNHEDAQSIVQTIRDILSTDAQVIQPAADGEVNGDDFSTANYWDASSMAPLNAVSAVSTTPGPGARCHVCPGQGLTQLHSLLSTGDTKLTQTWKSRLPSLDYGLSNHHPPRYGTACI
jgi:hypothetical protein